MLMYLYIDFFHLNIYSVDRDFDRVNMLLLFPPGTSRQCVEIFIMDDDVLESIETFSVQLTTTDESVFPIRNSSTVDIVDNDSKFCTVHHVLCHKVISWSALLSDRINSWS